MNIFFPQVAEQTIYSPIFAEQSFSHKKTIAPPQESMVGPRIFAEQSFSHKKTIAPPPKNQWSAQDCSANIGE